MPPTAPRLELIDVTKRFPGVVANDAVSLRVQEGEIHAILGENGAGKSTLMKIIYGALKPDCGDILIDGKRCSIGDPRAARQLGISMVYQHFSLFESLTVAQNVWLGLGHQSSLQQVSDHIEQTARSFGMHIDPRHPVHALSVGQRQRVEIIRALISHPRLLILDEPTSSLTPQTVESLFQTLRQLAAQGCSILYISHKLHEIERLCSAATVLRAGRVSGRCDPRTVGADALSRLMIGQAPPAPIHARGPVGPPALQVRNLTVGRARPYGVDLSDINLCVHQGQIVGIAGISGNGQGELLDCLSGEDTRAPNASILVASQPCGRAPVAQRRALGVHLVPAERLGRGAIPALTLERNTLLTRADTLSKWGWISLKRLRAQTQAIIERFNVKASGPGALAQQLSGGNLQKFIMGREIDAKPLLLIAAQPTWGVDVGAAAQIHDCLLALARQGSAVLLLGEDIEELLDLCDTLHVMAGGTLSPPISRQDATPEMIGLWMSGLWDGPPPAPSPSLLSSPPSQEAPCPAP